MHAVHGRYEISRPGDQCPLTVGAPGFDAEQARLAVLRLEHIARWTKIVELRNPGSLIPTDAVQLEILQPQDHGDWQPASEGGVRLAYQWDQNGWRQPCFKVRLVNRGGMRLFCLLLDLPETFGVFPILKGSGGIWLEHGQEAWANDGQPLYAEIPDPLWQAGTYEFKDTLKLIVSTEECDATLLAQDDLPTSTAQVQDQMQDQVQGPAHRGTDPIDVAVGHGREQGNCNRAATDVLGDRKVAFAETERAIEREQVQCRIVDPDADAEFLHRGDEGTAVGAAGKQRLEHVPVGVLEIGWRQGEAERGIDLLEVAAREPPAAFGELGEMRQLPEADGGGDVGEVELAAEDVDVHAAVREALDALQAQAFAQCRIDVVRQHQRAALAGGHVLVGVEAEGDEVAAVAK